MLDLRRTIFAGLAAAVNAWNGVNTFPFREL
jgi:hypothetical protein